MRVLALLAALSINLHAASLDPEEQRIAKVEQQLPELLSPLQDSAQHQLKQLRTATNSQAKLTKAGQQLWRKAVTQVQAGQPDDRPLYWTRLWLRRELKNAAALTEKDLAPLELASRGINDIQFDQNADVRILITGFDPFFLDRYLHQANPSGLAALSLDGQVLSLNGRTAEIEAAMIPVRFADFDQGMIESLLTPYLQRQSVDMIVTISMGREDFDLERFPGLNRSAKAPGNRNIYTGAEQQNPIPPKLYDQDLSGPQFVEFSLPVAAMQKAEGRWKINDNRQVETVEKGALLADSLASLSGQTSVAGSGGGYLSNEISYRSILLGQQLGIDVPTGHIHTPAIRGYDGETAQAVVDQIRAMLTHAIAGLESNHEG
ncbi:hypothetical protein CHH28_19015 [Bacterioplanes sanyensis]|uniref:Pyroglutamyl peptidase n=2 Tax=Bacterioplanes sanyensis TaxID=1249553 RepID=A0A222FQG4_9GAMM|nr:hypothetical protein CHH28_19015 [Bacterioplanes sanyensis]